jgi:hypothetical protein
VSDRKILFHQCPHCGLLRKDASLFPDPWAEKKRYEYHAAPDSRYVRWVRGFVSEAIVPWTSPCESLDFGSGRTGELARQLRSLGYWVREYDLWFAPDPTALQQKYDLVAALEVVEHFRDPRSEWTRLDLLLRPGARLTVHTGFLPAEWFGWWYLRDLTHYTFYPDSCWQPLADRFGWIILYNNHRNCIVFQKPGT